MVGSLALCKAFQGAADTHTEVRLIWTKPRSNAKESVLDRSDRSDRIDHFNVQMQKQRLHPESVRQIGSYNSFSFR